MAQKTTTTTAGRNVLALSLIAAWLTACAPFDNPMPLYERQVPIADDDDSPSVRRMPLLERVLEQGLPELPVRQAFYYFDQNRSNFRNSRHMGIIDFREHSSVRRFYMIDLNTGQVDSLLTAHGSGSDPNHTGFATRFSNTPGSHMSSIGFYRVAERYIGKWGPSLRLDGLEASNSNARSRAIVIHPASYVEQGRSPLGRSEGCPAVEFQWIDQVIDRLRDGALLYAYYDQSWLPPGASQNLQSL